MTPAPRAAADEPRAGDGAIADTVPEARSERPIVEAETDASTAAPQAATSEAAAGETGATPAETETASGAPDRDGAEVLAAEVVAVAAPIGADASEEATASQAAADRVAGLGTATADAETPTLSPEAPVSATEADHVSAMAPTSWRRRRCGSARCVVRSAGSGKLSAQATASEEIADYDAETNSKAVAATAAAAETTHESGEADAKHPPYRPRRRFR